LNDKVRHADRETRRGDGADQGFTLVELLVVIAILGILSGLAVFGVATFRSQATNAACKADVATVSSAATAYDAATGSYPANIAALTGGGYLRATPSGTYTFNATTKTATRDPACAA
jgi:general secretion pathway protein G